MMPNVVSSLNYDNNGCKLYKKINDVKDSTYFKTKSAAYQNVSFYVQLLCEKIKGTGNKVFNSNYKVVDQTIGKCSKLMEKLGKCCDSTDLNVANTAKTLRFGHVAFRDWHDSMKQICRDFIDRELSSKETINNQYKEELFVYLTESFGNKMRIDYGTGHELNFIIFSMGLCNLVELANKPPSGGDTSNSDLVITREKLKSFVEAYGWDIHGLFSKDYLKLCRKVQNKFRLEPAGSRGVYNMDDFQFLPFLFGSAQLIGVNHISTTNFYEVDQVDLFKGDFIFFEAVNFILDNKRGPFNEHSYTLWGFTNLGSWDNIFRRIKSKFNDDVLNPFPINQHFLFGDYILKWESQ